MGPLEIEEEQEDRNMVEQEMIPKPYEVTQVETFQQEEQECIREAWERMISLMRACPEDSVSNEECIHSFYYGLEEYGQQALDSAAGGSFLSILASEACRILHTRNYETEFEEWVIESSNENDLVEEEEEDEEESSPYKLTDEDEDSRIEEDTRPEKKVLKFKQTENEDINDAWKKMTSLIRACAIGAYCDTDYLSIFYHGLYDYAQELLDIASNGFFLAQPPRNAYKMLNERTYEQSYQEMSNSEKKHTAGAPDDLTTPPVADLFCINTISTENTNEDITKNCLLQTLCEQAVTFGEVQEKLWNLLSEIQERQRFGDMENRKLGERIKELLDKNLESPLGRLRANDLFKEMFVPREESILHGAKRGIENINNHEGEKKQKITVNDMVRDKGKAKSSSPQVRSNLPDTSSVGGIDNSFL